VFCCCKKLFCISPISRFDVFSSHQGCTEWLSELVNSFCQLEPVWPFSIDLSHQQGVSVRKTAAHGMIFLYCTILSKF
ncbi:hypothetical protein PGIGA_G00147110, partial [Pangasianodon gigas]|nr:hypothetical protein [Pangasianodon gigas]